LDYYPKLPCHGQVRQLANEQFNKMINMFTGQ
jgi:hypothetical protein